MIWWRCFRDPRPAFLQRNMQIVRACICAKFKSSACRSTHVHYRISWPWTLHPIGRASAWFISVHFWCCVYTQDVARPESRSTKYRLCGCLGDGSIVLATIDHCVRRETSPLFRTFSCPYLYKTHIPEENCSRAVQGHKNFSLGHGIADLSFWVLTMVPGSGIRVDLCSLTTVQHFFFVSEAEILQPSGGREVLDVWGD